MTAAPARKTGTVVVSGLASDAHTWNLVYLQLLIEELGHEVVNLGPCVPDALLMDACSRHRPELVVLSSVNGHGYQDGMRVIAALRARPELADTTVVIGGKLGIAGADPRHAEHLLAAGFDAVYQDTIEDVAAFRALLSGLRLQVAS